MNRDRRLIIAMYFLIDVLVISASLYIPYCLRYNERLIFAVLPEWNNVFLLFLFWAAGLVLFLKSRGLYGTDRSVTIPQETVRVFVCVMFSSVLVGLMIFILQMKFFSRLVFIQSFLLLFFSLSAWRAAKRLLIRYRMVRGYYNQNVLIVGAGQAGIALVSEIESCPHLGLKVVGFFDNYKHGRIAGHPVLSHTIAEFPHVLQKYFIDEIYITIPSERALVSQVIAACRQMQKTAHVLADNFTLPVYNLELQHVGIMPMIKYLGARQHGTDLYVKRMLDVCLAVIGLIVLAPIFLVIAIAIKADSPGPVFYVSKRCGKKGRMFHFYKFRSMIDGADTQKASLRDQSEVTGPIFKMRDDPRITRVGRLLRRYSLDELPQLWNVLKGDMSLVGPRPPTPDEVEQYDIWQMRRLDVRPGITCLWQVRGRSNLSFYKWVKWDLWYIDNWSFALDMMILVWTIPAVFKRKGAY